MSIWTLRTATIQPGGMCCPLCWFQTTQKLYLRLPFPGHSFYLIGVITPSLCSIARSPQISFTNLILGLFKVDISYSNLYGPPILQVFNDG